MATRAAAVAGAAGLMLGGSVAVLADTAPAAVVVVHAGDHQQGKVSSLADYGDRVLAADYGDGVTAAAVG